MFLHEYLDENKLASHVARGIVTCKSHPTLPLNIYCYGRKAIYDNIWDDVTCKTRGLIVDYKTDEIIARPFEKFFNYETEGRKETYGRNVEAVEKEFGSPVIQEKVNGSLGIFWKHGIHWGIATKGSFQSDHAKFATKWLEDHVEKLGRGLVFPEGYTPVFEIICQDIQEHVIKYDQDGLVLLSFINKETGEEMSPNDARFYAYKNILPVPHTWGILTLKGALKFDVSTFEGFVATYRKPGQAPLKLKIKFPTYMENRKKFYAELEAKKAEEKIVANGPEYEAIFKKVTEIVKTGLVSCTTRKEYAELFSKEENKEYFSICFALIDEGDYKKLIWDLIEKRAKSR